MLHIFWIHSHITFLLSREVIKEIDEDDEILVFLSREYSMPFSIEKSNVQVVSFPWYRESNKSPHNILLKSNVYRTRRNVRTCKAQLSNYLNRRAFLLYIPTSWEYTIGMLMTDRLCTGYFYIEEGSLSYLPNGKELNNSFIRKIVAKSVYNLSYFGMLSVTSKFLGSYASSTEAFPWNKKRKYLIDITPISKYFDDYSDIERILIFDHLIMETEDLNKLVDFLCVYFKRYRKGSIGYKFHPATKSKPFKENYIRERLLEIEACELPENFVVELYLAGKSKALYSINRNSSLLIYAKRLGSKAFVVVPDVSNSNYFQIEQL